MDATVMLRVPEPQTSSNRQTNMSTRTYRTCKRLAAAGGVALIASTSIQCDEGSRKPTPVPVPSSTSSPDASTLATSLAGVYRASSNDILIDTASKMTRVAMIFQRSSSAEGKKGLPDCPDMVDVDFGSFSTANERRKALTEDAVESMEITIAANAKTVLSTEVKNYGGKVRCVVERTETLEIDGDSIYLGDGTRNHVTLEGDILTVVRYEKGADATVQSLSLSAPEQSWMLGKYEMVHDSREKLVISSTQPHVVHDLVRHVGSKSGPVSHGTVCHTRQTLASASVEFSATSSDASSVEVRGTVAPVELVEDSLNDPDCAKHLELFLAKHPTGHTVAWSIAHGGHGTLLFNAFEYRRVED